MEIMLFEEFMNSLNEREFSPEKRKELAEKGYAMEDGSYPIESKQDVENAVKSFGRTGENKAETKAHIIKRAKALGVYSEVIPDKWKK